MAALALAAILVLLLRWTYPDGDTRFALAWGAELLHGGAPQFGGLVPVKHPLTLLLGAATSLLPPSATIDATAIGALLCFGVLAYASFSLGRSIAGPAAGALAALVVLTRPELVYAAIVARKDLLFAALVILAAALVARDPRRHWRWAMGLLVAGGLIRPEAWAITAVYAAWLLWRGQLSVGERRGVVAFALAAPLLWAATDLLLTGDPLDTPGSGSEAAAIEAAGFDESSSGPQTRGVRRLGGFLEIGIPGIIGWPATVAALLVAVYELRRWRAGALGSSAAALGAIAGILAAMLASAVLLNLLVLPLLERFLIVAAVVIAVLAASAAGRTSKSPLLAAALAVLVVGLVVAAPSDFDETRALAERTEANRDDADQLASLLGRRRVARALERCPRLQVGANVRTSAQFARATMAIELDVATRDIAPRRRPQLAKGMSIVAYKEPELARRMRRDDRAAPPRTVDRAGDWDFVSAC